MGRAVRMSQRNRLGPATHALSDNCVPSGYVVLTADFLVGPTGLFHAWAYA